MKHTPGMIVRVHISLGLSKNRRATRAKMKHVADESMMNTSQTARAAR